jgi:hypothetical protein
MATRSTIALEFADGTVQQVYCHWDGYLEHNGQILQKHYIDPFKLRDLIDLGDLSSLAPQVGVEHAFGHIGTDMTQAQYTELYGDMCTFYGRDRKESGCGAKKFKDFEDYKANHQCEEYEYILRACGDKAVWFVSDHGKDFMPLTEALEVLVEEEAA